MKDSNHKGDRIAKVIARAGVCSRRDAEKLIVDLQVAVNGQIIDSPALNVVPEDRITVNGTVIVGKERTRLFLYHKPAGLVTSHKDEQGRATVFGDIPSGFPRLVSVGRLDLNTEGLLLMTNDGGLSRHLELPATGLSRAYRARVYGDVDERALKDLGRGVSIAGVRYKPIQAKLEKKGKNSWISLVLHEGKNREIRRVMEHLGLQVGRLIRVSYGDFKLGALPVSGIEEISEADLKRAVPGFFK